MSVPQAPFAQFQNLLREMFQFDHNELDFGLFKVLRLKRTYIEQFISGDGTQDLKHIVARELESIRGADTEDERQWLANRCDLLGLKAKTAWAAVAASPQDPALQTKLTAVLQTAEDEAQLDNTQSRLKAWLQTQSYSTSHLEAQLYNYLLNYFELYYQNGDFGYNARATSAFKVPYEADYDGADTLFHWKHKDCYYIKTANSFPEVRLQVMDKTVVFRLQAGGDADTAAQNNNKDSDIKQYRLADITEQEGAWVVRFQLAKAGTPKAEIYARLWHAALDASADLAPYLSQKSLEGEKPVFKDLGKDHDKAEGGQIKGINQLRLSEDAYLDAIAKNDAFKALGKNAEARADALKNDATATALHQLDKALNRFYVGQDADYFIHKDLRGFLTREKDRFIKNVVFSNLEALLDRRADAATLIIARAFNAVAGRIIEFLDATETFQRNLYTLKKKVIDTHWLISVGKIPAAYWPRLLQNQRLLDYFQTEFKQAVATVDDLQAQPTLVVDTSLFTTPSERALVDELLSDPAFDHLDEQTDGLLVHSENWQALNLLQDKFRERIKCIYIDPPYNTGGDGFLYKDSFRHSSWAAMMAQGLSVAKSFMPEDGQLFCSIDGNEKENLRQVAKEAFLGLPVLEIIRTTGTPTAQGTTGLSNTYDSILLCGKALKAHLYGLPLSDEDKQIYNQEDNTGRYLTRLLRMTGEEDRREDRPDMYYGVKAPNDTTVFPIGPGGYESRWRLSENEYLERLEKGNIEWKLTSGADDEDNDEEDSVYSNPCWKPYIKFYMPSSKTIQNLWNDIEGNKKGKRDLKNVLGQVKKLTPKPIGLIRRIIEASTLPGTTVLDYFGGTGTTACAVMQANAASDLERRKWIVCEFGDIFFEAKRRISRLHFSNNWKAGNPIQERIQGSLGIVKVQRLEQYEDVIANLDTAWDEAAMPAGIPVRYLFRPEENRVRMALDLSRPFGNMICVGKAREAVPLDLLESWALLQGYWQRSRRVMVEGGKRYLCLETVCGCLVILRDITEPEDDSAVLNAIAAGYTHADGSRRIQRLEVNHWADLRRVALPCVLVTGTDFDRGAAWV